MVLVWEENKETNYSCAREIQDKDFPPSESQKFNRKDSSIACEITHEN